MNGHGNIVFHLFSRMYNLQVILMCIFIFVIYHHIYRLQPHAETKARQLSAWRSLILDYHRVKKESILDVHEAVRGPLFFNTSINRKLEFDFILLILNDLMQSKNAAPCDKSKNRWEIYWHTLEEWASLIYNYVVNSGLTNTVCTFFELTQSEDVINEGKKYKL